MHARLREVFQTRCAPPCTFRQSCCPCVDLNQANSGDALVQVISEGLDPRGGGVIPVVAEEEGGNGVAVSPPRHSRK